MHLYTILLDYSGGTYASQLSAADEQDALRRWIDCLVDQNAVAESLAEVVAAFAETDDQPVRLEGLVNAWCACASAKNGLALVNIVRTAN